MATAERILTDEMIAEIQAYFPRYPTKQVITLPTLHVVHHRLREVSKQAVVEIAELLELAPAQVQDTLTFYNFFYQDQPHGQTRAWVCRSISCSLRGGEEILAGMCKQLGIQEGGTTKDGKLTLQAGECLGACEFAPCMLAGDTLHKDLTPESAAEFLKSLE